MARQNINYGVNPNDGTGDTLRNAMDKINDNFIELYNSDSQNINITDAGIVNTEINGNIVLDVNGTGTVQTTQGIRVNTGFENSNSIFYAQDGTDLLTIDVANKRLAINKPTASATIDVNGTAIFSGNVRASSSLIVGTNINDRLTLNARIFGNIIPGITSNIGEAGNSWAALYADTLFVNQINASTNISANNITATQFTGDLVGQLVTNDDIILNNGILSTRINTQTLTGPRQIDFPDLSGIVVTKNSGRMSGPYGSAPTNLIGNSSDQQGDIAFDDDFLYYCIAEYDGSTEIWKKIALSSTGVTDTLTGLSLASNTLSYTDEAGNTTNIDLSLYLDDTNLARIVNGTLDSNTGIATFIRDDSSTFTVDFSALFDDTDTNLPRITLGTFDIFNGELSLIRDDSTSVVVDLDGRYLNFSQAGPPGTSIGIPGDKVGDTAFDENYVYYCTSTYDGSTAIWKRVALSSW